VARNRCDAGGYEAISAGNAARVRRRRGLVKLREGPVSSADIRHACYYVGPHWQCLARDNLPDDL